MTREELRQELLAGADALRNSVAWRFMNARQRTLSTVIRAFWATNDSVTNPALDKVAASLDAPRFAAAPTSGEPGFFTMLGILGVLFLDDGWQWVKGLFTGKKP